MPMAIGRSSSSFTSERHTLPGLRIVPVQVLERRGVPEKDGPQGVHWALEV